MRKTLIAFVLLLLLFPVIALAQDSGEPPAASATWEFVGILISGGLVAALLQLFRRINLLSLIPDWLRPVLAGGVGIGTTWLTAYALANFGIELDLSAIVAFFGAGGGATALFAIGKNLGLLNSAG